MTKPLAFVLYEAILPGSQIVNRLQDMGYRVQTVSDPRSLTALAALERPMIVLADLHSSSANVPEAIRDLRANPETSHIPVLGFVAPEHQELQEAAASAGATLVAGSTEILDQLPELLDQALVVD